MTIKRTQPKRVSTNWQRVLPRNHERSSSSWTWWLPGWALTSLMSNALFVDAVNWNDGTAVPYDMSKPYEKIETALAAAASWDTIWVRPGTYVSTPVTGLVWLQITKDIHIHCTDWVLWDTWTNAASVQAWVRIDGSFDFVLTWYMETVVTTSGSTSFWFIWSWGTNNDLLDLEFKKIERYQAVGFSAVIATLDPRKVRIRGDVVLTWPEALFARCDWALNFKWDVDIQWGGYAFITTNHAWYVVVDDFVIEWTIKNNDNTFPLIVPSSMTGKIIMRGHLENRGTWDVIWMVSDGDYILDHCTVVAAWARTVWALAGAKKLYCYSAVLNKPIDPTANILVPAYTIDSNVI